MQIPMSIESAKATRKREHAIRIGKPHGQPAQPWWKFW